MTFFPANAYKIAGTEGTARNAAAKTRSQRPGRVLAVHGLCEELRDLAASG